MKIRNRRLKIVTFGTLAVVLSTILLSNKLDNQKMIFWFIISVIIILALFMLYWLFLCEEDPVEHGPNEDFENKIITNNTIANTDGIFIGRQDEIDDILKLFDKYSIVIIKGAPGLGKSTLARYLRYDEKTERRFKKSYFVKLEKSKIFATESEDVQEYIAQKMLETFMTGYDDNISFTKQVGEKLREMGDRLIILDNTEQINDSDLVETIGMWSENLNNNTRFLLTSRDIHKELTKGVFRLKPLEIRKKASEEQTEACIVTIKKLELSKKGWKYTETKENNIALFEITKKTEGVPWCIDSIAGIFYEKNYTLIELADSIKSMVIPKDDSNDRTEFFFEKSFLEMNSDTQKAFIQTCVFDSDFERSDFLSVVDSQYNKEKLLKKLVDHSFLRDLENGYYSLYVHVKEYGLKKLETLETIEKENLLSRFSNHYYNKIKVSSKEKINEEIGNYIKTQEILIKFSEIEKSASLILLLDRTIEAKGSVGMREKLVRISYEPIPNEANQTKVELGLRLSEIYFAKGDWIKAESYAKKCMFYAENNSLLKVKSYLKLAKIFKENGYLQESLRILSDCHVAINANNFNKNINIMYNSIKLNLYDQLGMLNEFNNALASLNYSEKSNEMAQLYNRIGLKEWHHSNIKNSIIAFDKAIEIAQELNNETWEAAYNTNKALAKIDLQAYNDALFAFNNNISTHRISGRLAWQSVTYGGKGRTLLRRNDRNFADHIGAEENLLNALSISEKLNYSENISWIKGDLARLYLNGNFHNSNLEKAHILVKESLSLHKNMGAVRNVRYFSSYITLLMIHERKGTESNNIEFIETLYILLDLYKEYISVDIETPVKVLQEDINYLNKIIWKYFKLKLDYIKEKEISEILNKLYTDKSIVDILQIVKLNILNEKEGSYEYYADQNENQWKYFRAPESVTIFAYGILMNNKFLKLFSPIGEILRAKGYGISKKINHVFPKSTNYLNEELFSNGDAILNVDYTGFLSNESYGIIFNLSKENFAKMENLEKGYALRPITCKIIGKNNEIKKVYTLTSTNRIYVKQKLTNNNIQMNNDYMKLCIEGAKSYGRDFYDKWNSLELNNLS